MDNPAGASDGAFTSALSVNEFVLTRDAGFNPAGFVAGTAVFQHGLVAVTPTRGDLTEVSGGRNYDGRDASGGTELDALNRAAYAARDAAVARMTAQAIVNSADGIVGVTFTMTSPPEWADGTAPPGLIDNSYPPELDVVEFTATGTAVRYRDPRARDSSCRARDGGPFMAGLSGQDCWALLRSGYQPAGVAMGYCAYRAAAASTEYRGRDREITSLTRAVYAARETAMRRLQEEASRLPPAEGVVGFQFHAAPHFTLGGAAGRGLPGPQVMVFFATGTVIAHIPSAPAAAPPTPVLRFS
jgi:uncharacterized protein YbjQ (UPF0145 family)